MGGVADFFTGSGPKVQSPYTGGDKAIATLLQGLLSGDTLQNAGQQFGTPNAYQSQAGNAFSNFDPNSFLSGVQNYLGQGAQLAGGPGLAGSENLLGKTIAGNFLDVTGGPYAQRNDAIAQATQRLLNQNLDTIGASAQRATGGVGAGSAGTEQKGRAVSQAGSQLGETLANLSAQDLARERGIQSDAMGLGLNLPLQRASAFQGLGSILGQAGTAAGNLELQRAQGLGNFGQGVAQQQMQGQLTPIDYLIKYLASSHGVALGQDSGGFGRFASGFADLGQGAKSFAGI